MNRRQFQLRDEALDHCAIYFRRLSERLGENSLTGPDLLTLLDLSHQLLKELYVAAIAHQAEGAQALLAIMPHKNHGLRFEHDLSLLHDKLAVNTEITAPNSLPWPATAHYLLTYSFALKKIGEKPANEKEATFRKDLELIHGKAWNEDADIQKVILDTYIFPSLEVADLLLKKGFVYS